MFKFFPDEGETEPLPSDSSEKCKTLRISEEMEVKQINYEIAAQMPVSVIKESFVLKYIRVADLLNSQFVTRDENVKNILESTSDLLPGQYEGGFKIWECTFDLLGYLEDNLKDIVIGPGIKVLDLGCGSGLLGLYALSKGASVVFQDYNSEVLNFLTIPNTIANFSDEGVARCRYFSGDWGSFLELVQNKRLTNGESEFVFDYILSSETVYNTEYLPNLIKITKACLKPTGSLFLAAKTCYFGVGGGTKAFTNLINKDSALNIETEKVIRQGIQREILHVTGKSS